MFTQPLRPTPCACFTAPGRCEPTAIALALVARLDGLTRPHASPGSGAMGLDSPSAETFRIPNCKDCQADRTWESEVSLIFDQRAATRLQRGIRGRATATRAERAADQDRYCTSTPASGSSLGLSMAVRATPTPAARSRALLGDGPGRGDRRDGQPALGAVQAAERPAAVELPDRHQVEQVDHAPSLARAAQIGCWVSDVRRRPQAPRPGPRSVRPGRPGRPVWGRSTPASAG